MANEAKLVSNNIGNCVFCLFFTKMCGDLIEGMAGV